MENYQGIEAEFVNKLLDKSLSKWNTLRPSWCFTSCSKEQPVILNSLPIWMYEN